MNSIKSLKGINQETWNSLSPKKVFHAPCVWRAVLFLSSARVDCYIEVGVKVYAEVDGMRLWMAIL